MWASIIRQIIVFFVMIMASVNHGVVVVTMHPGPARNSMAFFDGWENSSTKTYIRPILRVDVAVKLWHVQCPG